MIGCSQILGISNPRSDGTGGGGDAAGGSDADSNSQACVPLPNFGTPKNFSIPGATGLAVGDLNHDGTVDIAVATSSDVIVLLGTGGGNLGAAHPLDSTATPAEQIYIADVDHDGYSDLISCGPFSTSITVRRQDPSQPGKFLAAVVSTTSSQMGNCHSSGVANFNSDDLPDFVYVGGGSASSEVLFGDSATPGKFTAGPTFSTLGATMIVGAADIDGDGLDDLEMVHAGGVPPISVAYNQTTTPGTFTTPANIGGSNPGAIVFGHYAGNGARMDLVTGGQSSSGTLFGQASARTFTEVSSTAFGGPLAMSNSVVMRDVDLNGDGLDDIVGDGKAALQCSAGQFYPAANASSPVAFGTTGAVARVFGDLDANGKVDLVEVSADQQFVIVSPQ